VADDHRLPRQGRRKPEEGDGLGPPAGPGRPAIGGEIAGGGTADNRRGKDYLKVMAAGSPTTRGTFVKTALIAVPLLAMLVAAGWIAARAWISISGPPLPVAGYVAMALGIGFSLVVGCGLMALLFYSNRHGYDEPYRAEDDETGA
jgi:hypothetical protein